MPNIQKPKAEKRKETINIRALTQQQLLIDKAALIANKSRTDFMLDAACKEAEEVLLDQRLFFASEQQMNAFEDALNQPPTRALEELLASKSPWEK
ncbi:DUF1778 domain-containing protein [Zooshikella ganghwensis]|uniref:type II toxin-antitoxin system TacA family antitoxin n=1 Tax=Zooshikella ganghwensis TaxID=202772 RepID=UPI0003F6D71A|nr:DUF1778 domain-containing protein [Zooshikella ganghwensis]